MVRIAKTSLLALGLILGPISRTRAQAVSGALAGQVLNLQGEPLDSAVVSVGGATLQGRRSIATDQQGRFLFPTLPAGRYIVEVRLVGYAPVRVTDVTVVLGGTTSLGELRLASQAVALDEIVVSAARPVVDATTPAAVAVFDSSGS